MNFRRYLSIMLCLPLFACGNADSFRDTLGLNRKGPDEFQVFSRPPLTVPPDYNLPVPKNGAEYAVGAPADEQAHSIVAGKPPVPAAASTHSAATAVPEVSSAPLPNNADSQFLSNAGAEKADKNIRQTITSDNNNGVAPKSSTYLISPNNTDPLVDPAKEAQRLKQDKQQNQPPTKGDTPVIQQDKGILGDIF